MFFYLSKLSYFFISPANWMFLLLLWRFITRSAKIKKRLNIVLLILLFTFGNEVLYTRMATAWQTAPAKLPTSFSAEAGIVLGGMVSFDKNRNGYLNSASDRLIETYVLYRTGMIKKIIVAGGSVKKDRPAESPFLYKKLVQLGADKADIIIEHQSRTTYENALYTRKILDSLHLAKPLVLITSALHMPRAMQTFQNAGIEVIPYPANYVVLNKKFAWTAYIIPDLPTIISWNMLMKEMVGTLAYTIFNKA